MSKAVMLSIRPKWVEKIANGKKTIEVRKTKPKLETPFAICASAFPEFAQQRREEGSPCKYWEFCGKTHQEVYGDGDR